jgi:predicted outer membrane repeat protein
LHRFVFVAVALAVAGSAGAETFPVTTTMDGTDAVPGDHSCATDSGECTLRAAVMEVNALALLDPGVEHLITLPMPGVYGLDIGGRDEDAGAMGDLDFHANVIVRGSGLPTDTCPTACEATPETVTVIDARGQDRAIHIHVGKVTFQNLVIRGGHLPNTDAPGADIGGGILNRGQLQLGNVSLHGNEAEEGGGLMNEGTAALFQVSVLWNSAHGEFGAQCGGGISNSGTLTVVDALVAENEAPWSTGGGLCLGGTASVTDTLVRDNVARFGGGVSVVDGLHPGTATLVDVRLRNNLARGIGGGIVNEAALSLDRVILLRNEAQNDDCGRPGCGSGGGIGNYGTLTAVDSTVRENRAYNDGGGLWNAQGTVRFSGTLFEGNVVGNDGAGVFASGGHLDVINTTFSGNRANRYGGGIHAQGYAEVEVRHATFTANWGFAAGGALRTLGDGRIRVKASAVALNGGGNCRSDPVGRIVSEGYNVEDLTYCPFHLPTDREDADVRLDPMLRDNGGPNGTHALFADSAAIDLVPPGECPLLDGLTPLATDQRGQPRPGGAGCDAGAYEATPFLLPIRFFCCESLFFRIEITLSAATALSLDLGMALKKAGSPAGAEQAEAMGAQAGSAHEALEALAHAGKGQGGPAAFALLSRIEEANGLAQDIAACCGKLAPEAMRRVASKLVEAEDLAQRLVGRMGRVERKGQ